MGQKKKGNTNSFDQTSTHIENIYARLMNHSQVKDGLQFIKEDHENTVSEQIQLTEIPAPSFKEEQRANEYKKQLEQLGLKDVQMDKEGNVFGLRPGTGNGPRLFVSAHLDTVFPEETDTTACWKEGKVYAPGIADDGRGLAVVLSLVRTMEHTGIETKGDIIFGATVGEEGVGDLRGVKAFFDTHDDIDGFISIEPGSPVRTTYLGTGSRRYRVTFTGPGGHSFGAFGLPSAIHALGRAIAEISDLKTAEEPKTTFTVGTVEGGTSVNTIAAKASMLLDMRSDSQDELLQLEQRVLSMIDHAVQEENKRWDNNEKIQVQTELIGDRPAGSQRPDAPIVQAAMISAEVLGFEPKLGKSSSTDANVPINLGIPAITLGGGGDFGGAHTLDEFFDPQEAYYGVQKTFLTVLGLVGVANDTSPVLEDRDLSKR